MRSVTKVHGPFTELGSNKRRRREKSDILNRIENGRCPCEMCGDRDRTLGVPSPAMWSAHPGDEGEVYLCQGPDDPFGGA